MAMGSHMAMTELQPLQPGDKARANAVLEQAKQVADRYKDFRTALADGYTPILPEQKQTTYHFQRHGAGAPSRERFDAANPAMLLYEKEGDGYKLVGMMYTAPFSATDAELNARIPLSIAEWHAHVNFCRPPKGYAGDWVTHDARFGLSGSIATEQECRAAGGTFTAHGGWMTHVYPFHNEPGKIWNPGMVDDHGQGHDMMEGMEGMMGPAK
jgi:hypothetical protein